jgi:hypothetical protein
MPCSLFRQVLHIIYNDIFFYRIGIGTVGGQIKRTKFNLCKSDH